MASLVTFAAANPITEITSAFGVDGPKFFSQVILVLFVAFIMKKFAFSAVQKTLEDRRTKIAESLANAEKIKQELAKAQAKAEEILTLASKDANRHIQEAREAAAKVLEAETQKAIATANDIVTKARQASEAELARMKAELRREVGRLVVQTTAKVAGKVLTAEDQQRLADEATRHLAA
ncbi:MAG: F0F1 ATP synthase subunit B [Verrucomicrobia bacterium]|nr:F0F1 ATP synthase subunit B [Verrucomicrobiota bacterium]